MEEEQRRDRRSWRSPEGAGIFEEGHREATPPGMTTFALEPHVAPGQGVFRGSGVAADADDLFRWIRDLPVLVHLPAARGGGGAGGDAGSGGAAGSGGS